MDKDFEDRFGALYDGVKPNNAKSVSFYFLFIVRRIILCMTILYMDKRPSG